MISVCMATYNGEKYIKEQLDSILGQLGQEDELIISDDCSTDSTLDIIQGYKDSRIRLFSGYKHKSLIHNFENALRRAKGEYIFLSDQDDVWAHNKVECMLVYLRKFDCVVSDCFVTDGNLKVKQESFYELNHSRKNKFYNLFVSNPYLGCCMAFKGNVLRKCLPFPSNIPMHDIWIGNVAAFYFSTVFIEDRLIYFRRHGKNSSVTGGKSRYSLVQKLGMRVRVMTSLLCVLVKK